jgi:hypothetical protein
MPQLQLTMFPLGVTHTTAQFCVNGHTQQMEIVRAFGVTKISVKRSVKLYREEGARGFYKQKIAGVRRF